MTLKFESYRVKHKIIIIKNKCNIIGELRLNYNLEYTYTNRRYVLYSIIKTKRNIFVTMKYSCGHIFCHHEIFLSPQVVQFF